MICHDIRINIENRQRKGEKKVTPLEHLLSWEQRPPTHDKGNIPKLTGVRWKQNPDTKENELEIQEKAERLEGTNGS